MVAASLIRGIAFVAAFFSAAFLSSSFLSQAHSVRDIYRAYSSELGRKGIFAFMLRKKVIFLSSFAGALLKNKNISHFFNEIKALLEERRYSTTLLNVATWYCLALIVLFAVSSFIGSSILIALVIVCGAIVASCSAVNHLNERRAEAIREEIPDALRSMSVCSHVGYSLQQTFAQAGHEVAEPLNALFLRAAHDLDTGKTADEALEDFRRRANISELSFVAVALDVQHKAGGSLRQVLDAARDSVESELELKRNLRVQTAQAKLSARIVSLMPFILIGLFSFLSPGFLKPFFQSIEGFSLLGLAAFMQIAGIILVRKLLNVAVD